MAKVSPEQRIQAVQRYLNGNEHKQTKFGFKKGNLMVIKFIDASTHPQSKMQYRDLFL